MNVDEAMEIAEQLSGGSLNFRHHSNLRALAIGALYNEVNRLRAACSKYSEDELLQGDWKARALKAEAELAAAKAASVVPEINWQPMETAPKDGTVILLATTVRVAESSWGVCRPQFDGYVANNGEPCWRASCEQKMRGGFPLYWMPMPPYPSQDNPPPAT